MVEKFTVGNFYFYESMNGYIIKITKISPQPQSVDEFIYHYDFVMSIGTDEITKEERYFWSGAPMTWYMYPLNYHIKHEIITHWVKWS